MYCPWEVLFTSDNVVHAMEFPNEQKDTNALAVLLFHCLRVQLVFLQRNLLTDWQVSIFTIVSLFNWWICHGLDLINGNIDHPSLFFHASKMSSKN